MAQKFDEGEKAGIDKRNLEIAHNLLLKNYDINTIAEITGLNLDIIKSIKTQKNR
jgi:hypothetical protein